MLRIVVSQAGNRLGAGDYALGLVRIGSDEDNDLQVEHEALAPHHLEVYLFGKRAYARSPEAQPLSVDGEPVEGRAELRDGQSVEVGPFSFQVRIAPPKDEPSELPVYESGRMKLAGTELLALPARDEEQRLMLAARRILVGQGVDEAELARLRDGGLDRARDILREHAGEGLNAVAQQLRAEGQITSPTVVRRRKEARIDALRLLKLALLLAAALSATSLFVTRISALFLSFSP